MLNRVVLIGRLTKDPDLRYTTSGVPVTRFTLAVNEFYEQPGEREADFIPSRHGGAPLKQSNICQSRLVAVVGRIQTAVMSKMAAPVWEVAADEVRFLEWQ